MAFIAQLLGDKGRDKGGWVTTARVSRAVVQVGDVCLKVGDACGEKDGRKPILER